MAILKVDYGTIGGAIDHEIDFKLVTYGNYNTCEVFRTDQFKSFKILITNVTSAYPLRLSVSNDNIDYTVIKSWTATQDYYEEIYNLVKDYTYFLFNTSNAGATSAIIIRATTISNDLDFTSRIATVSGTYTNNCQFATKDIESISIKITDKTTANYTLKVFGSNGGVTWSQLKEWSAVHTDYEDITSLIRNYEYIYFASQNSYQYIVDFKIKLNPPLAKYIYKRYESGDTVYCGTTPATLRNNVITIDTGIKNLKKFVWFAKVQNRTETQMVCYLDDLYPNAYSSACMGVNTSYNKSFGTTSSQQCMIDTGSDIANGIIKILTNSAAMGDVEAGFWYAQ